MVLEQAAFDIETTGFDVDDEVTTVGFAVPMGVQVFVQTGDCPVRDLQGTVQEQVPVHVDVSTHTSEQELLAAVTGFVEERLSDSDVLLVAYNGERWNGGFDLPFLRTRLCTHAIDWPFGSLPYVDVLDVFEKRFNTTEDTLCGVYGELIGRGLNDLDPFTDSADAVTTWEDGRFEPLLTHNVADIRRTRALMDLAERYCSKSDFSMKSLDPVA